MTGLPSINDTYGLQSLDWKVSHYDPGWYLGWNGIGPLELKALSNYQIEEVAGYPVFDDDERNILILYRLKRRSR